MNKYIIAISTLGLFGLANADVTVGEKLSEDVCSDCHFVEEAEMTDLGVTFESIKGIVDGTVKHRKKLKLTDEEIASLIEYFATIEPIE